MFLFDYRGLPMDDEEGKQLPVVHGEGGRNNTPFISRETTG
jgi:hypothetical protein